MHCALALAASVPCMRKWGSTAEWEGNEIAIAVDSGHELHMHTLCTYARGAALRKKKRQTEDRQERAPYNTRMNIFIFSYIAGIFTSFFSPFNRSVCIHAYVCIGLSNLRIIDEFDGKWEDEFDGEISITK